MLQQLTSRLIQGENLTSEESRQAFHELISENCPEVAAASFLTALACKGETPTELAAFGLEMRARCRKVRNPHRISVDTAGTGGGRESFNVSTVAALVVAGASVPVAKHGNRAVTSRSGSADLLAQLGLPAEAPQEVVERALEKVGITFIFAPLFHPALGRLAALRRQIGHRTIFNVVGPLTNPASASIQLIGVWDAGLVEKAGRALLALGSRRAWVVHNSFGMDELATGGTNKVCEVRGQKMRTFEFRARDLGFPEATVESYAGGDAAQNAQICRDILSGRLAGPARDIVVLNAAAALHLALNLDLPEAVQSACHSIDSGMAQQKLRALIDEFTEGEASG